MKFSIALTTYQSGIYLERQLASLADQIRQPDELVVCDDGSTDGTLSRLEEFRGRVKFPVRIFTNEKNLGYAQNFARAISLCEGDWIFLCDHDDEWSPSKLSRFEEKIQADPQLVALFSDSALVDQEMRSLHTSLFATNRFHDYERAYLRAGRAWRAFIRHNVIAGHALAFRAGLRAQLLPIPPGWVHDAWLSTRLALLGKIDFLEDCLVSYRQHPHQHIGVVSGGPWQKIRARLGRMGTREKLAAEAEAWRQLRQAPEWNQNPEAAEALAEKIAWLEGRAALSSWKVARLPFLARNAGLYFRYDNGWQTMLKDFLIG